MESRKWKAESGKQKVESRKWKAEGGKGKTIVKPFIIQVMRAVRMKVNVIVSVEYDRSGM